MRISDWSSDVCSSDLPVDLDFEIGDLMRELRRKTAQRVGIDLDARAFHRRDHRHQRAIDHLVDPRATLGGQPRLEAPPQPERHRSEEHTSELQSLMRLSYAVFGLNKKTSKKNN